MTNVFSAVQLSVLPAGTDTVVAVLSITVAAAVVKKTVIVYVTACFDGFVAVPEARQPSEPPEQPVSATFLRSATVFGTSAGTGAGVTPTGRGPTSVDAFAAGEPDGGAAAAVHPLSAATASNDAPTIADRTRA